MPSQGPYFVVFNIGSGHGDREAAKAIITDTLRGAGREVELLVVDNPSELCHIADHAVKQAVARDGIVVAAGGDGTINTVAQAVLDSERPFGVLPQGTFNYFGRAHGISQETAVAVKQLLGASVMPTQVGLLNERVFLVNASIGLYPRLLEDREIYKKRFGRSRFVAAWAAIITVLTRHRHWLLELDTQGQSALLRTSTVVVGNNPLQLARLGIPEARAVEHGRLAGIALKPIGIFATFALMMRGAFGQLGGADNVLNFAFTKLTVSPALPGRRTIKVAFDGEVASMKPPLVFKLAPKALQLLVPAEAERVAIE